MFKGLFAKRIARETRGAYEIGLAKGYELGYMMGKTETSNRGFIIGSKVDREIGEILREKGVSSE